MRSLPACASGQKDQGTGGADKNILRSSGACEEREISNKKCLAACLPVYLLSVLLGEICAVPLK